MQTQHRIFDRLKNAAAGVILAGCVFSAPMIGGSSGLCQETAERAEALVGGEFTYQVRRRDSLTSIGARHGVDSRVIAATNGFSANSVLREGRSISIDNRHIIPQGIGDGILINLPQRMLYLFKSGRLARAFPVGLGRPDWQTPTGFFTIRSKEQNPFWDVPESIQEEMRREGKVVMERVPPCPENPLGKHWMGLSIPGFGIHGTIAPASIYSFQTHGCIRVHPDDIALLFEEVTEGAVVGLIYQRVLIARSGGGVFLEVHRDVYRKQPDGLELLRLAVKLADLEPLIDWDKANAVLTKQEGIARDISRKAAPVGDHTSSKTQFAAAGRAK
jgi:L,D-transpeptidase ErfK/SrfK